MRRILIGDVMHLARHIATLPGSDQLGAAFRILLDAEEADHYRRASGKAHPEYGTGSIMAAVGRRERVADIDFDDLDHLDAMDRAIGAIRAHIYNRQQEDAA